MSNIFKRCFLVVFLVLGLIGTNVQLAKADCNGKIISVADGDTLTVECDNKQIEVRLDGIDAPETNQSYGDKATEFLSSLVFDKTVNLIEKGKDKYGRTLGVILLSDGRILNREIVKEGFAWHYKQYSNDTTLNKLEKEAKSSHKGLWNDVDPTAPWDFRHSTEIIDETSSAKIKSDSNQKPSTSQKTQEFKPEKKSEQKEIIVYITRTGTKYHRVGCQYLRKSVIPISLKEAKNRGYLPCSRCNPPY
ncbi:MAG: thermonuclease family protein [Elusimicrobia bacterium]|nr:thermonuclease family protein [Elusimicrobiota bacterium]